MEKGQIMLITVLTLSGIILGATTIGGLLMTYQIRQSSNITNSAKAIMAADAGIEYQLYNHFKGEAAGGTSYRAEEFNFNNGVSAVSKFCQGQPDCPEDCPFNSIVSYGDSNGVYRAFEMCFTENLNP